MDFVVEGRTYHASKMNAMDQFQVLRRLAPIMGSFGGLMNFMSNREAAPMTQPEMLTAISPLAKAISELSDEATNYIFDKCFGLVTRDEPGGRGAARIWNVQAKRMQMDDIDLPAMMQILVKVLEGSFENFFRGGPQSSTGVESPPPGRQLN